MSNLGLSSQLARRAPRRVLFVNHTAEVGGGEVALLNLVRHLDQRRYRPAVLTFADGPLVALLAEAGVDVEVLPLARSVTDARKDALSWRTLLQGRDVGRTVRHVWAVRAAIRRARPDLIHANSLKADVIAGLAGRLAGVPVVWHVRDRIADDYLPPAVVRAFRHLARWVPRHVIANSRATLATLDLPPSRPGTAVYSGIDLARAADDIPPAPGGLRTGPTVGLIGRISPWKGQHVFVRAAVELHRRYPSGRFLVVGAPLFGEHAYERQVHALTAELGLGDAIEFTGHRTDVGRVIAGLDVLVHASTAGEPFGQVIVEAMAAGKPVVATDGGGVPEVVDHGVTGLLVPMDDPAAMASAVARLLDDPATAAAMGRAGRDRVRRLFTIGHCVDDLQAVYDALLGEGQARPSAVGVGD